MQIFRVEKTDFQDKLLGIQSLSWIANRQFNALAKATWKKNFFVELLGSFCTFSYLLYLDFSSQTQKEWQIVKIYRTCFYCGNVTFLQFSLLALSGILVIRFLRSTCHSFLQTSVKWTLLGTVPGGANGVKVDGPFAVGEVFSFVAIHYPSTVSSLFHSPNRITWFEKFYILPAQYGNTFVDKHDRVQR